MAAFALATAAVTATVETIEPEWRDPEFGCRLRQLRKWKAEVPKRPLVVVLGSSRAQMGISPRAMALPGGPNDPLVYNFGYRGASPLWTWLILMRLLDCGIRPDFLLVQIALAECVNPKPAEEQVADWTGRLSLADVRRLHAYVEDKWRLPFDWLATRPSAWSTFSEGIRSDLWPRWQPYCTRSSYTWEVMDEYGHVPYPSRQVKAAERNRWMHEAFQMHRRSIGGAPVSAIVRQVHRDMVSRCTREGIAVAFAWSPESPRYRGAYGLAGPESIEEYSCFLGKDLRESVFRPPTHLAEEDFADGFHLLPAGAVQYSRWLADTDLRPWLARHPR